uniref:Uncharacterized protein n=1 Tax=Panstrongylus lignarius TaxID=156445 RepID=A0A224XX63_9HEMI
MSSQIGSIPAVFFSLANFISILIASTTSLRNCLIACIASCAIAILFTPGFPLRFFIGDSFTCCRSFISPPFFDL